MKKVVQNREELEKRAERVAHHMSYQLGFQDRNYKSDKDALFLGVALQGSFFTKTYFSDRLRRFKVDNVRPTDLIVNYNVGPIRIEDVRRKSHIIYTTVGETDEAARRGFLTSPAISCQQEGKSLYNVKVDEATNTNEPAYSLKRDRPAILVEQHLYLDIDGEGYRPYIVTFDLANKKVKRLTINWEADKLGNPLKDFEQIQYFTHYKYRENPDGFYGFGLGQDIGDLNSAINIMLRQTMDSATLATHGNNSGFISDRLGLEGDEIELTFGKFRKIPDTVGDLKNAVMTMDFKGPSEVLPTLMEFLDTRAGRMASTNEATTGTMDKVVQPTALLSQIEQSLENFSSVQMRIADAIGDELQKIYRINQKYLPFVDYYMINDAPEMITRADYADDMLIQPIFDPKFSTQGQKVARSQAVAQVVMQNPMSTQRPQVMDAITRRQLEALDVENIDELVPPVEPQRIDDQMEENMNFLMPPGSAPPFDVFPDQDHITHLTQLEQFVGEKGKSLMPEQQAQVIAHKQKHEAYQYAIDKGLLPGPGQPSSLAAGPNDQMDTGEAPQDIPAEALAGFAGGQGQLNALGI